MKRTCSNEVHVATRLFLLTALTQTKASHHTNMFATDILLVTAVDYNQGQDISTTSTFEFLRPFCYRLFFLLLFLHTTYTTDLCLGTQLHGLSDCNNLWSEYHHS